MWIVIMRSKVMVMVWKEVLIFVLERETDLESEFVLAMEKGMSDKVIYVERILMNALKWRS